MKYLFTLLIFVFVVSTNAQQRLETKTGTGYSYLTKYDDLFSSSYKSGIDFSLGAALVNDQKIFTIKKELNLEIFRFKGMESHLLKPAGYSISDANGYVLISSIKFLPQLKTGEKSYINAGLILGSNFMSHWKFNYNGWSMFGATHYSHGINSGQATGKFSKLFLGCEMNYGQFLKSKKGKNPGIELGIFFHFKYAKSLNNDYNFNRTGFKLSVLNPTELLKKN